MIKALFLDRDGVINEDKGYLYKAEHVKFTKGIFRFMKTAVSLGFELFVVTNQSGLARGMYQQSDVLELHKWMENELEKEDISIRKFYICPHHPSLTGSCKCRKPETGMFRAAEKEFDIDMSSSVMIGDKKSDVQAGKNAGVAFNILVKSKYASEPLPEADFFAADLHEAEQALRNYCEA